MKEEKLQKKVGLSAMVERKKKSYKFNLSDFNKKMLMECEDSNESEILLNKNIPYNLYGTIYGYEDHMDYFSSEELEDIKKNRPDLIVERDSITYVKNYEITGTLYKGKERLEFNEDSVFPVHKNVYDKIMELLNTVKNQDRYLIKFSFKHYIEPEVVQGDEDSINLGMVESFELVNARRIKYFRSFMVRKRKNRSYKKLMKIIRKL